MTANTEDVFAILFAEKLISQCMIPSLEQFAAKWRISKFQTVLETNLASEELLADLLAKRLNLPRMTHLSSDMFNPKVFNLLPISVARARHCLPLNFEKNDETRLKVLIADPTNLESIAALENATGKKIVAVVATLGDIVNGITTYYPADKQLGKLGKH